MKYHNGIVILLLSYFVGCDSGVKLREATNNAATNFQEQIDALESDPSKKKISSLLLDSVLKIYTPKVSLKKYLTHEVPLISFKRSDNTDFVRILRCPRNISIGTRDLLEYGKSSVSEEQMSDLIVEDIVMKATGNRKCEYLPVDSENPEQILDYWSLNGSWLYMIIPCVSPSRLVYGSTSRECSKYFVVVYDIKNKKYENKMKERSKEYFEKSKKFAEETYQSAKSVSYLSKQAVQALGQCSEREFTREKSKVVKEAFLGMASAVIDFAMEYWSWDKKDIKEKGLWNGTSMMDKLQLLQAPGGFTFKETLNDIFASAQDMPRKCTAYMKIYAKIQLQTCKMINYSNLNVVYKTLADNIEKGHNAFSGVMAGFDPNDFSSDPNADATRCTSNAFAGN
jgi:hypothetical protein